MTANEIATRIFYSPATNGKAENSIKEGELLIELYAHKHYTKGYMEGVKSMDDCQTQDGKETQ